LLFKIIDAFVDFSHIFLLKILIFKGLTARRLYKSFGVKGLTTITLDTDDSLMHCADVRDFQSQPVDGSTSRAVLCVRPHNSIIMANLMPQTIKVTRDQ
jgi:hypothetical protein